MSLFSRVRAWLNADPSDAPADEVEAPEAPRNSRPSDPAPDRYARTRVW